MQLSIRQIEIEREIRLGTGSLAVKATAGAGKTTTLLLCLNSIPKFKKTVFLSFSKTIVGELRERVPRHIKACTLHSLGFRFIMQHFKGVKLDEDKYFKKAMSMFPRSSDFGSKESKDNFKHACYVKEIVNYARMTLVPFDVEPLKAMCIHYSLEYNPDVLEKSIKILQGIKKDRVITVDFTDMIYLPVARPEIITERFDVVCWDECQDANAAQMEFVSLIRMDNNARVVAVGDDKQAIYGFMGSTVDSFQNIISKFQMKEMGLSVTYRCSKDVVKMAQTIYAEIEPAEHAEEGETRVGTFGEIGEGDMVLSRTTLPLIGLFFMLLERNIKATIIGKEIEAGLVDFAKKVVASTFELVSKKIKDQLIICELELKEMGYQKPTTHKNYIALVEKVQVIQLILNKIDNPLNLISKIHELFHEDKNAARLMTIHKSKGLEAKRVFVVESYNGKQLMPSEYAVQDWEKIQEKNLLFVCYTRAKQSLVLIDLMG